MNSSCTKVCELCGKHAQDEEKDEPKTAYQLCRITARKDGQKIIQEQAAHDLNVSRRQLSAYETGESPVPDDMVVAMAEYYETPILVWWHMKHHTVFGKYLPDVPELKTPGDIIFAGVITQEKYSKMLGKLKDIFEDWKVTKIEEPEYKRCLHDMRIMGASLLVMAMSGEQIKIEDAA